MQKYVFPLPGKMFSKLAKACVSTIGKYGSISNGKFVLTAKKNSFWPKNIVLLLVGNMFPLLAIAVFTRKNMLFPLEGNMFPLLQEIVFTCKTMCFH